MSALCSVEACTRAPRSPRSRYCEMHYYRLRRTGQTGPASQVKRPITSTTCEVEGCDRDRHPGLRMCKMHDTRMRRWGDPHHTTPGTRGNPADRPSYGTAHKRVKAARGPARNHLCHCGKPATQWAYDHTDPNPLREWVRSPNGKRWLADYSADTSRYTPMCTAHHREFDRGRGRGAEVAV